MGIVFSVARNHMLNCAVEATIDTCYTALSLDVLTASSGRPGICNQAMAEITSNWEQVADAIMRSDRVPACALTAHCLQLCNVYWDGGRILPAFYFVQPFLQITAPPLHSGWHR